MRVASPDIIAAVELASDLRKRMGKRRLSDLPKGKVGSPKQCILAKAFNFDCTVSMRGLQWVVRFPFSEMTDEQRTAIVEWAWQNKLQQGWGALTFRLPQQIGNIAVRFDRGQLPEYDRARRSPPPLLG